MLQSIRRPVVDPWANWSKPVFARSSAVFCQMVCATIVSIQLFSLIVKNSLAFKLKLLLEISNNVMFPPGPLQVILGGGRMYMTPKGTPDPEYPTSSSRKGDRKDKINLIDVWLKAKPVRLIIY